MVLRILALDVSIGIDHLCSTASPADHLYFSADIDKINRCGLKVGKDRVIGPAVADVCKASHVC